MEEITLKAIVDQLYQVDLLDKDLDELDYVKLDSDKYHFIIDGISYTVCITLIDTVNKRIKLKVNGKKYSIDIENKTDLIIEKLGFNVVNAQQNLALISPMPGVIRKIYVNKGDEVTKGDPLIVLEAMKMENILSASSDSIVDDIFVAEGESIGKDHELIKFDYK